MSTFSLDVSEILLVDMDGCEPTTRWIAEHNARADRQLSPIKERSAAKLCKTTSHTLAQLEPNIVARVHPRSLKEVDSVQKLLALCSAHGEHVYPFLRVTGGTWDKLLDMWIMIHEDSANPLQYGQMEGEENWFAC